MQKTSTKFLAGTVLSAALLTGCAMNAIDYNNRVVDDMEAAADAVEDSLDTYEAVVPLYFEPELYGDFADMEASYDEAVEAVEVLQELLALESVDGEQQAIAREGMEDYYETAQEYFEKYIEVMDYHKAGIDPVADFDAAVAIEDELYALYNETIDIFNQLGDDMWDFVE